MLFPSIMNTSLTTGHQFVTIRQTVMLDATPKATRYEGYFAFGAQVEGVRFQVVAPTLTEAIKILDQEYNVTVMK